MANGEKAKTWLQEFLWRFFGALFMEEKTLPTGARTRAASLHRVLALVSFLVCLVLWLSTGSLEGLDPEVIAAMKDAGIDLAKVLETGGNVPESLLWTMWGLLGLNGTHKAVEVVARAKAKPSPPGAS